MQEFDYSFPKVERLHQNKLIESLFETGKSIHYYPIKAIWLAIPNTEEPSVQVLITVPKKNFKRAVYRNLLKRRIKEAYRLNKSVLTASPAIKNTRILLALVYTAAKVSSFAEIQEKIILILRRLSLEDEKNTG